VGYQPANPQISKRSLMSYQNGSVIITGGSKGIGLAIAKIFARKSDRPLVLIARNKSDLESAKEVCEAEGAEHVTIISADLTREEDISGIDFQALNPALLINNAGVYLYKYLGDTTPSEFEEQFRLNVLSAFLTTKYVLPQLKRQDRALIVNICSQASLRGYPDSGAYTMAKHATLGYTRSLRGELADEQIAVTAINLGQTFSTSWKDVDIDSEKLIDPEDVGRIILSLSELSRRTVAEEINIMPQGGEVDPV